MHSRKRGRSRSHHPVGRPVARWIDYDADEIKMLVTKFLTSEKSQAETGIILRDTYGIPDVRSYGIRIAKVARSLPDRPPVPEDLYNLMKKVVILHKHMDKNSKDKKGKHGMELLESKIRRLGKYYSRTGRIDKKWKYTIEQAELIVK